MEFEEAENSIAEMIREGFSSAFNYEQARPGYPRQPIEFLLAKLGVLKSLSQENRPLVILELGSGTGKFTRVMLDVLKDKNATIIASDPVKNMCEQFKERENHSMSSREISPA